MVSIRQLKEKETMNKNEIKLGAEYKDKISDFVGIAIAKTEWINGCNRVTLAPKLDKDGKFQDSICLDVEQLEATGVEVVITQSDVGGDRNTPSREPVVRMASAR